VQRQEQSEEVCDVPIHNLERAWQTWTLMEATGWQFLPYSGGLLEQPESVLEDLLMVATVSQRVKTNVEQ